MRCPNCKLDNPDGSRTCSQCGTPLLRVCSRCGFENPATFKFCGQCAAPLASSAQPAPAPPSTADFPAPTFDRLSPVPPSPVPSWRTPQSTVQSLSNEDSLEDMGEQRQVTVLFCDLVGAAQLSQRLDPEDMHRVVRAYQAAAEAVIQRHGGYVAQYLGDGLLVYFGYPEEREGSARSAVLAALEIVDAVSGLASRLDATRGVDIAARIGMHSGEGVAGDVGGKLKREQLVVGRVPNIAARILSLASPGTVLASEATKTLVDDDVEVLSLGPRSLKGIAEPIGIYRILSRKQAPMSIPGTRARATPFVGPAAQLDALIAMAREALAGRGSAALVSGEEGSGKTRLMRELRGRLAGSGLEVWVARCRAKSRGAPLEPFAAVVSRILLREEISAAAPPHVGVEASVEAVPAPSDMTLVRRALGDGAERDEQAHLIGALLGSPPESLPPIAPLTPAARAERTRRAVADLFLALAQRSAALLVVEDLQLADPSSLALFAELATRASSVTTGPQAAPNPGAPAPGGRLLLCGTFAPPFTVPPALAAATRFEIAPLDEGAAAALLRAATAPVELTAETERRILDRAGGVPLHIVEMARAASRAKAQGVEPNDALLDLRGAVLDALSGVGPAREVAWMASVLGPRFERDALGALCPFDAAMVKLSIDALIDAGIFALDGSGSALFSHSLVRDAVYDSLAPVRRRDAHEKAARVAARRPGPADVREAIVAWHLERAGLAEEAAQHLTEAAQRALAAGATAEALSLLDRALALVTNHLDGPLRQRLEVELRTARAEALLAAQGPSAPGVAQQLARAKDLCKRVDAPFEMLRIVRAQWLIARWQSNAPAVVAYVEELASLAARSADPAWTRFASLAAATTAFYRGRLKEARGDIGRVLAGERSSGDSLGMFSEDATVAALALRAWIEAVEGARSDALATIAAAEELAASLDDPVGAVRVAVAKMVIYRDLDEPSLALEAARRALDMAERQCVPVFSAAARCGLGWALGRTGSPDAGIAEIEAGLDVFRKSSRKIELAYWIGHLADVCLHAGRFDAAGRALDEAMSLTGTQLDAIFKPEILRLTGDLVAARDLDPGRASALYQRAAETARAYGALSWALAAAAALKELGQPPP